MNHSDLAEKVRSLAIPVAILVLVAAILVTSRLNSPSRYFSGDTFAGCYSDGFSNQIRLSKEKEILADGRPVGHYRIVSPVGGKHGYLVETTDIKVLKLPDGRITIQSGSGGFLWPISENGNLQMLFAPDGNVSMHRDKNCSQ